MPTVTNKRKSGTIICEGVHLSPGPNEITDEAAARLQKSPAYQRHARRGWLGGLPKPGAAPAAPTGAPTGAAVVAPPTNPAQSDGSPPDAGTKHEEAAQDFPEALDRSKSRAPGVKR
jgi:hypothetical protein